MSDLDELLGYRPEAASAIARLRRRYLAGEIEVDEFEDGVERALVGRASAAEEAFAAQLAAERRVMSDWVRGQHDLALRRSVGEGVSQPQTLESVDAILKSLYKGPIF